MNKPHGDHDFDYDLVITATNNAMLSTIFTYKASITKNYEILYFLNEIQNCLIFRSAINSALISLSEYPLYLKYKR